MRSARLSTLLGFKSWRLPGGRPRSGPRIWLRTLALFAVCLLLSMPVASQERPKLVVYLHTSIRSRALQTALAQKMPAVDVVVCGRYRDFTREIGQSADAALALQPVLRAHNLALDLRGFRGTEETEPYVLLSVGASVDKSQFARLIVGSVDLLGRDNTAKFVASLLELRSAPEIKYVVKSEDLLALLQFRSADAVVLSEQEAQHIKSLSKLDLRVTPLAARVGLPAVTFRTDAGRRIVRSSIEALDVDTRRKLGVDAWR